MANVNSPARESPSRELKDKEKDDADLDPAAFLKSVRELSEKRDREDAQRLRNLEEEIQKGREERAARRAERARSISPDKQSTPARRTLPRSNTNASLADSPSVAMNPPASTVDTSATAKTAMEPEKPATPGAGDVPEFKGFGSIKRSSTASSARSSVISSNDNPTQSASNLARSGTLSWQQRPRPGSKLGGSRPQSMASPERKTEHASKPSVDEPEPSRDQIAASLGARDPSWFRQTADRGVGNAAYRKSKDETGRAESPFGRRGLPGMSRESSIEPEGHGSPPGSGSIRSDLVSRGGSVRDSTFSTASGYSATSTSSANRPDLKSLIAADEDQHRASPSFDQSSVASGDSGSMARTMTMSSSQARIANASERPSSPTKGMGGFVQSAFMKRADSQNKRWSAQPGGSLSRGNSVASTRSGLGGLQGSHSMPKLEPTPGSREGSNEPTSRPTSSSNDLPGLAQNSAQDNEGFVKPALPHHNRSKSVASNYSTNDESAVPQSPGSPSKRFSPNKSSWIESSLLTKPESPKPASASKNAQPSWMADLAKAKAQRASVDMSAATKPEDEGSRPPSRPGSPTKSTPFGPALLKRSESRADSISRSGTPKPQETDGSRPASPSKSTPFGQDVLKHSKSRDFPKTPQSATSSSTIRPLRLADKFTSSPAESIPSLNAVPVEPVESNESNEPRAVAESPSKVETKEEKAPLEPSESKPQSAAEPQPAPAEVEPSDPEATANTPSRNQTLKSSPEKTKPETPTKPQTDFRSQLRSRPTSEAKQPDQPEFLSKFGNLRKTQQEKYVAPDVLKDNILRGKTGLSVTGGPVKSPRKDELRDSLIAKKDDIKKAKEEGRDLPGQAHERKTSSGVPQAPSKPEALARKELLGRSDSGRSVQSMEKAREATPEALSRHKSLRSRSNITSPTKEEPRSAPSGEPGQLGKERSESIDIIEPKPEPLMRQTSSPKPESSKLASRFNPGLASMLARGPPSASPSRPESPGTPARIGSPAVSSSAEPPAADEPLEDVRKGRAKGPKRRKGGARTETASSAMPASETKPAPDVANASELQASDRSNGEAGTTNAVPEESTKPPATKAKPSALPGSAASIMAASLNKAPRPVSVGPYGEGPQQTSQSQEDVSAPPTKPKPQALPGSAAAIMRASLNKSPRPDQAFEAEKKPSTPSKSAFSSPGVVDLQQKPATPVKSPSLMSKTSSEKARESDAPAQAFVPEFRGFGSARASRSSDENKENTGETTPSVKSAASQWGRRPSPQKSDTPSQIQLPTKKDDDEAMRSAGLLAASGSAKKGLGISTDNTGEKSTTTPLASAGLPPKPTKSSRVVSGQLAEASPNNGLLTVPTPSAEPPNTEAGWALAKIFGGVPKCQDPLAIETQAVLSACNQEPESEVTKTLRKVVQAFSSDGSSKALPPQEDYTLFDESVYVCLHVFTNTRGAKNAHVYVWMGDSASESAGEAAQVAARKSAKENSAGNVRMVRQGQEPAAFFEALGGILITRRGSREGASKQYMLSGRKHLGHIAFDEVPFSVSQLCPGFVYLISYPVTLQQTKLYLWKGQACSAEELSAARLAAMDLSETGEIIEVDGGVEFASFLKIFGQGTTKWSVPKPSELWQQKAVAPDKFKARLFRVQQTEVKAGLLSSLWSRRPSWNSVSPARSPARSPADEIKVEVKELSPFTQSQLEAEGIYLLDAHSEIFILIGPLFSSHQPEKARDFLFAQTLFFAEDYAVKAASMEERPVVPKCSVLVAGVPRDVRMLFRFWQEERGLWGTGGLMAGSASAALRGEGVKLLPLEEVVGEVRG